MTAVQSTGMPTRMTQSKKSKGDDKPLTRKDLLELLQEFPQQEQYKNNQAIGTLG